MARVIGTPGESGARRGALLIVVSFVLLFLFVFLPSFYVVVRETGRRGLMGLLVVSLGLALGIIWRRRDFAEVAEGIREGRDYLRGAQGEILVHHALKELSDDYIVFHDFHPVASDGTVARWNVDHIVVGPTGVFVLDAKYYGRERVASAERNRFSRKNVSQVQRNSMDLKSNLVKWSAGELGELFVVPIVVYAQPDASLERLREGSVRTLPLRLLRHEIESHAEAAINQERAGRIARVLYSQIGSDLRYRFKAEFDAYGEIARIARYAARDARLAQPATVHTANEIAPTVAPELPTTCPRCGGALVRRIARFGVRAGRPFLGCSNYSKTGCRYGINLDE